MASGRGAYITDADGKEYVDLVGSWGPMILGHSHPSVIDAVRSAVDRGLSFGTPGAGEVALCEEIVARVAPVEQVRLVSSGTEATMSAIRLARGFTGRPKIVKFAGCYHGHVDALLASAGSGVATFALPDSAGVTASHHRRGDRVAVQRHRGGPRCLRRGAGTDRRSHHRGVRRQHGCRPTAAGIQRRAGRDRPRRRGTADLGRGDDRVPAQSIRHVRPGRRDRGLAARSADVRQGDRRWSSGRRIRRPGGRHESVGAARPGLPGGHSVR